MRDLVSVLRSTAVLSVKVLQRAVTASWRHGAESREPSCAQSCNRPHALLFEAEAVSIPESRIHSIVDIMIAADLRKARACAPWDLVDG